MKVKRRHETSKCTVHVNPVKPKYNGRKRFAWCVVKQVEASFVDGCDPKSDTLILGDPGMSSWK